MLKLTRNYYRGRLIVFEGTDGAGKTTLINMTAKYLAETIGEENIILTKQPTDLSRKTKLFQKMMYCSKNDEINYRAVQLLTLSDRVQQNFEEIVPALQEGKTIICDRYIYTSIANMLARGYTDEKWFFKACKEIIKPDLTFLTYVPPEIAIKRIKSRPEECNRHLNEALLFKVADQFLKMQKAAGFIQIKTDVKPQQAFTTVQKYLEILFGEREWRKAI